MPRSKRNRTLPAAALSSGVVLAGFAATPLSAADWEISPRVQAGGLYDTNYRLAPEEAEIEVSGALADVQLEFKRATPVTEFTFTPRARATYFPDDKEENSEDYFVMLDALRRGQRYEAALRIDLADEDVVSSEQPGTDIDGGLGEPGVGEGGLAIVRNRRQLISVVPTLSHEVSQRHSLLYDLRYIDVTFDDRIPGLQVPYIDGSAGFGWQWAATERSRLTTRLRGARYDIDDSPERSDAYSLEFEWGAEATETMQSFLRVGAQNTDIVQASGGRNDEVSWIAGAGLRWTGGLSVFFTDLTRTVNPSSSGTIVERDQLRLRLDRAITPRFSFYTGVRGIQDRAVDRTSGYQGREYAIGELGARWRVLQTLAVIFSVDYAWQEFRAAPEEDATSSRAMITFLYEPRRRD